MNRNNDHRFPINEPHIEVGNNGLPWIKVVSIVINTESRYQYEIHDYSIFHLPWLKAIVPDHLCDTFAAKEKNR